MRGAWAVLTLLLTITFSGCASVDDSEPTPMSQPVGAPDLSYQPIEPDAAMVLDMFDIFPAGSTGNILHGRVVMPAGDGPFPTIVQHTPYTAPGCNVEADVLETFVEPPVGDCDEGRFENEFSRRGYVYIHADLRGTGDSNDCLNLRGQADIDDIGALADAIAAQPWSNGNVGFIGASYPGSTSHMAAMSGSEAVKAVIPIVASTSFYHYHHNDGVPYSGQHSMGGTNTGYTQQGVTPTFNPVSGLQKLIGQPLCPHVENAVVHGGSDQTGDYYGWWQERNLRGGAADITVPVLMAQGLADWNVKPDHIATWFNDLGSDSKTFIGGQWGHAYPATDDGACPDEYEAPEGFDCVVPWGDWWAYAAAFFDTYLKEIDTGMFEGSTAWVQDNGGSWHRSSSFPLMGDEASEQVLFFNHGPAGMLGPLATESGFVTWHACPRDTHNMGQFALAAAEEQTIQCENTDVVFTTPAFTEDTLISGVPLLNLTVDTDGKMVHLVAVMDVINEDGQVVRARENYGYLNTRFHRGFPVDDAIPTGAYPVTLDMYPQEDLIEAGHALRITLRSHDDGRSIEHFEETDVALLLDGQSSLILPIRSADLQGTRL